MPYPKKSADEKRATKAAQMRRYREKHPEKAKRPPEQAKKANATYRATHQQQIAAGKKRYVQRNKEQVNAYNRFRRKTRKPGQVALDPKDLLRRWTGQRRKLQDRQRENRDAVLVPLRVFERDAREAFSQAQRNFQKLAQTMAPARRASAEAGLRSLYATWQQAQRRLRDAMK